MYNIYYYMPTYGLIKDSLNILACIPIFSSLKTKLMDFFVFINCLQIVSFGSNNDCIMSSSSCEFYEIKMHLFSWNSLESCEQGKVSYSYIDHFTKLLPCKYE